jgi:hypothetical protein
MLESYPQKRKIKMTDINVRDKDPYYSQRNNQYTLNGISYSSRACQVTSMVSALDYAGYTFPKDEKWEQPEDSLLNFILTSPEIDTAYQQLFPEEYKKYIESGRNPKTTYPPEELHSLLSLGTNLWMGKKAGEITKFRFDLNIKEILFELLNKRAVVQSGVFVNLHHVVAVVGFTTNQDLEGIVDYNEIDLEKVVHFYVEDPYGNYHTDYKDLDGKDIVMSVEDYKNIFNVQDSETKWGHLFIKNS